MKKFLMFFAVLTLVLGSYATSNADAKAGAKIFKKYCAKCHGTDGTVSQYGKKMKPRSARNLTTNRIFIAPRELISIIKYGLYGREMKGWELVLKDKEIIDVASFVRTLKYKPSVEAGKNFFKLRCSTCHAPKGAAKTLFRAPDLDMSPLGSVEMARVVRFGRHGTMMSPKRDIFTNTDLADVVAYLQSIKK